MSHFFVVVLTPDGVWHEQGDMCSFGVVDGIQEDWPQTVRMLLERHRNCIAVGVDCHI